MENEKEDPFAETEYEKKMEKEKVEPNEFYIAIAGEFCENDNYASLVHGSKDREEALKWASQWGGADTAVFKCRVVKKGTGPGFSMSVSEQGKMNIGINAGDMVLSIEGEELGSELETNVFVAEG